MIALNRATLLRLLKPVLTILAAALAALVLWHLYTYYTYAPQTRDGKIRADVVPLAADVLTSRGVMGDGYIDFAELTNAVAATDYRGDVEAEIFNTELWAMPVDQALQLVKERYEELVAPHL